MKYSYRLFSLLLAAATAAAAAAPAEAALTVRSVPPASFLDYHVDTVPQLTYEVNYDKAVQMRLARHFHMTGPQISAYVKDNLVLQRLSTPLRTRVYCINPRGHEYFVMMTLKTGTPVFALRRTGQPILRLVCGNPLVSALPPAPKKKLVAVKPAVKPAAKTLVESDQAVRVAPPAAPAEVAPAAWTVPSITTSGAGTLFTSAASSSSGAGWLALLPVLGGIVGVISTHHGSGGGDQGMTSVASPTPTTTTTDTGTTTMTMTTTPVTMTTTPVTMTTTPVTMTTTPVTMTTTPVTMPTTPTGNGPGDVLPTGPATTPTDGPAPVPEPSPTWVFAVGGLALAALRLRRK